MGEAGKIEIVCSRCRKQLAVRADMVGRAVRCPNTSCGARIEILAEPKEESEVDLLHADSPDEVLPRTGWGGKLARTGGRLPLLVSSAALIVACAALGVSIFRSPLGRGLSSYDFTSPDAAVKSLIQIEKNRDFKARFELADLRDGKSVEEMARTFEIHRSADFIDRKLLFVSYTRKGKKVKEIKSFEKDPESKLWIPTYVSTTDVKKVNEQLAKEMEAWERTDSN